jgi:dolichol-phosphate mannosyltransferase
MKTFVVIPTYKESLNIEPMIRAILELKISNLSILVVDDHSPDGTSEIVGRLAAENESVFLVERMNDKGRGTAGIVGFDFALQNGAECIIEMDADFSHPPTDLPRLLDAAQTADIAIASRLLPESTDTRPLSRRWVTFLANRYARFFLESAEHRSRIRDWTTGFRAYRRKVFDQVPIASLVSQGPSILQEVLYRALNQKLTAVEIPFQMNDRLRGSSTFSRKVAIQSLLAIPAYRVLFGSRGTAFRIGGYRTEKVTPQVFKLY